MYKLLKIGNKEYKLEYSIEASLYDDCVKSVMNTLLATSGGVDKTPEEMISGMANIPNTALTVFYAGLLQYHGDNPDADGSVPTLATAKKLVTQFIQEHKDDEQGNFYGVFAMCLEQMEEDGFQADRSGDAHGRSERSSQTEENSEEADRSPEKATAK